MAQAQPDQLHAAVDKGRVGTNQESVRALLHEARKCHINVGIAPGSEDFDLLANCGSRHLDLFDERLDHIWIVGTNEHGKTRGARQQLMQEPKPLWSKLPV